MGHDFQVGDIGIHERNHTCWKILDIQYRPAWTDLTCEMVMNCHAGLRKRMIRNFSSIQLTKLTKEWVTEQKQNDIEYWDKVMEIAQ